jgi:2-C-methyl-D-erythritol 4-phosphate cytidylyltransferase
MEYITAAVIVAAGNSTRMGSDKILAEISGKTVIRMTAEVFESCECINRIIIVGNSKNIDKIRRETSDLKKVDKVIKGGDTRQESVWKGVCAAGESDYIAIQDGARPFVTAEEISKVCADAGKYGAAVLCTPIKDTIKECDRYGFVKTTPDRKRLFAAATPQVFKRERYIEAIEKARCDKRDFTDDSQLYENIGEKVFLTLGSYENIKVTTPIDLMTGENIVISRSEKDNENR